MARCKSPDTDVDQRLACATKLFAESIGAVSSNLLLREGILQVAISMLVKALEEEFDGYQDLLSDLLKVQSELLWDGWEPRDSATRQ